MRSGLVCLRLRPTTYCRVAINFSECRGTTRSSWSAVSSSIEGYWMPSSSGSLTLWSGEYLRRIHKHLYIFSSRSSKKAISHWNYHSDVWQHSVLQSPIAHPRTANGTEQIAGSQMWSKYINLQRCMHPSHRNIKIAGMGNRERTTEAVKLIAGSILQRSKEMKTFFQHTCYFQVCTWMNGSFPYKTVSDGEKVLYTFTKICSHQYLYHFWTCRYSGGI